MEAAANAEVERLNEQLGTHEAEDSLDTIEAELASLLTSVRSAVEGAGQDKAGVAALTATLLRLFDHFTYHVGIPELANVELIESGCWIEPTLRAQYAQGQDEGMSFPGPEPLYQAKNNCLEGLPLHQLFGSIRVG